MDKVQHVPKDAPIRVVRWDEPGHQIVFETVDPDMWQGKSKERLYKKKTTKTVLLILPRSFLELPAISQARPVAHPSVRSYLKLCDTHSLWTKMILQTILCNRGTLFSEKLGNMLKLHTSILLRIAAFSCSTAVLAQSAPVNQASRCRCILFNLRCTSSWPNRSLKEV